MRTPAAKITGSELSTRYEERAVSTPNVPYTEMDVPGVNGSAKGAIQHWRHTAKCKPHSRTAHSAAVSRTAVLIGGSPTGELMTTGQSVATEAWESEWEPSGHT